MKKSILYVDLVYWPVLGDSKAQHKSNSCGLNHWTEGDQSRSLVVGGSHWQTITPFGIKSVIGLAFGLENPHGTNYVHAQLD